MEQSTSDSSLVELINVIYHSTNERQRRIILSALSNHIGRGSQSMICKVSGITMNTLTKGKKELKELQNKPVDEWPDMVQQVRDSGAGRKSLRAGNPEVFAAVSKMLDPDTKGSTASPLIWTTKSLRNIASSLKDTGVNISHVSAGRILEELGYDIQENPKSTPLTASDADRNRQFVRINRFAKHFMKQRQPVISVAVRKKEEVENAGNFQNRGTQGHHKGEPDLVFDHVFSEWKASPDGIYDDHASKGFAKAGITADTAEFAVSGILQWWTQMGNQMYPNASSLMITADSCGGNISKNSLWMAQLQKLANETGLKLFIFQFPVGTSKWRKIEHRMVSSITMNRRGRPLETVELIIDLIASCSGAKSVKSASQKDEALCKSTIRVSDLDLKEINTRKASWKGDWFYTIAPDISP